MPRPGPRRPQVAIRLDPATIDDIDQRAASYKVNRSEMVRTLIEIGLRHHIDDVPKYLREMGLNP